MTYKQRFFTHYVSTHIAERKGAVTLEEFHRRAPYYKGQLGHLLPKRRDAHIADVGCGNGSLVWYLQGTGYTAVEGVDVSIEQIAAGQALGLQAIQQADLRTYLAGKRERFDLVILRDVIEHFTKEEILGVLDQAVAALRPGGRLLIQVPNAEAPFAGRIRYGDFTHELAFSVSSLQQLLKIVGLDAIRCYPTVPVFLGPTAPLRQLLWRLVEACYKLMIFAEIGRGHYIVTQSLIAVGVRPAQLATTRG